MPFFSKEFNQGAYYNTILLDSLSLAGVVLFDGPLAVIAGPVSNLLSAPIEPITDLVNAGVGGVIGKIVGPLPDIPRFSTSGDYRNALIGIQVMNFVNLSPIGLVNAAIPKLAQDVVAAYVGEELGRATGMR